MKKLLLMFAILITLQHASFSQPKTIASVKAALESDKDDTTRLGIYLDLADSASLKDKLSYGELAVKVADKLLAQGPDTRVRKRLLQQKARAYNFIAVFYSAGRQANARKVIDYANRMLQIHTEIGDKKGIMQVYFGVAGTYLNANDSARFLQYAQKAVTLSLQIKDSLYIVEGYSWISQYYLSLGDFPEALEAIQKALAMSRQLNYQKGVAEVLLRRADLYRDNSENKQALQNYEEALPILYQLKDSSALFNGLAAIGGFYYKQNNVEKAIEYYHKVIALCQAKQDFKDKIPAVYDWMGQVYKDNKDYTNSLLYYEKSLSLFKEAKNVDFVVYNVYEVLNGIGDVYFEQGKTANAITYYTKALKMTEDVKYEIGIAASCIRLAQGYKEQRRYELAKKYSDKSLVILKKEFDLRQTAKAELLASEIDSAAGNGIGALTHYKEYVRLTNKLKGDEIHKQAQREKYESDFAQQRAIGKAEQDKRDAIAQAELRQEQTKRYALYGGVALLLIFAGFMYNRFKVTHKQKQVIEKQKALVEIEKQRSDELLLNILPAEVAEELKEKGRTQAKQFDRVTVMFTDFKNFTQISEKLSPKELVTEIDSCFKEFDNIITRHNIEKIKTIGDSYMCVGGLPVANETNAGDVVIAALEIQQFMQQQIQQRKSENKEPFEIRIGVHTGPVVAGIVGVKKFAYDIWGDTVNIASRMESSGEAGKVNVSGETYELVKDQFVCTHRGKIKAKNKGEIDMYFVEGISSINAVVGMNVSAAV